MATDSILLKQLTSDPNASAESLVQIPDLSNQDFLNFESIMSAWHSENPVVVAEKEPEQPEQPVATTPKIEDQPQEEKQLIEPEACTEKPEPEAEQTDEKNRALDLWPHLSVAEATQDSLLRLPEQTQDLILSQAQTRVSTLLGFLFPTCQVRVVRF